MAFSKRLVLTLLFFFSFQGLFAQINYPKGYFSSPMNIPLSAAGYFAELRGDHFHSGMDLRTNGKEGQCVLAPADGYVSRIKIQAFGGGKNLYLTHPNGYTTVYMHLQRYCKAIEDFVKAYQTSHNTYEFDTKVTEGLLTFKQGDTIAISGNTGASGGPHLHYEIRNTQTEHTINPQLFGLQMIDTIAPKIYNIEIVPWKEGSKVAFSDQRKIFSISESKTSPYPLLCEGDTVKVTGRVYLGLLAFDKMISKNDRNGVYCSQVFVDDSLFWQLKIDEFSFAATRYTNACIDYPLYKETSSRFLITRLLPNNLFSAFKTYSDNGIITVHNGQVVKVTYSLEDFAHNKTAFTFYLQGKPYYQIHGDFYEDIDSTEEEITECCWEEENKIAKNDAEFFLPQASLYEDAQVSYSYALDSITQLPLYSVLCSNALQKNMRVTIPVPDKFKSNPSLEGKLLVLQKEKTYFYSIGGRSNGDYIVAYTNDFGVFKVGFDTICPTITPLNFKVGRRIKNTQKTLRVKISDNLSGIRHYSAYINDKWVVAEYDGKKKTLIYTIDSQDLKEGENVLRVEITDRCNNKTQKAFPLNFLSRD